MSRSYKKNPYMKDNGKSKKWSKRKASQKFRRDMAESEELSKGSAYKKHFESWNIADYCSRMTRREAIEWYEHRAKDEASVYFLKRYPTLEKWLKYWEKCYYRK